MTPELQRLLNNTNTPAHVEWLSNAKDEEIEEYLKNITGPNHFRELALQERHKRHALNAITLSNQSLELMDKLNTQTNRLIEETISLRNFAETQVTLAHRMDWLTKWLVGLTVVLVVLTVVLAGDTLGLFHRDSKPAPQKTENSSSH